MLYFDNLAPFCSVKYFHFQDDTSVIREHQPRQYIAYPTLVGSERLGYLDARMSEWVGGLDLILQQLSEMK